MGRSGDDIEREREREKSWDKLKFEMKRRISQISGRWQAPAAVLPEGPKDQVESHSRARRAREWLKPASPRARRARGRAKHSRRLPVLLILYVFHDSAKNRDFHGTI